MLLRNKYYRLFYLNFLKNWCINLSFVCFYLRMFNIVYVVCMIKFYMKYGKLCIFLIICSIGEKYLINDIIYLINNK